MNTNLKEIFLEVFFDLIITQNFASTKKMLKLHYNFTFMLIYILSRHGTSYSTARLYNEAITRGHTVKIIDHMQCELKIGFESHIYYRGEKLEKPDCIIPRIGSSATFYGSNVVRQFEMMKVKTVVSADGLLSSRDKLRASQNMVFNNIEVPKTYFPAPYQDNFEYMISQVGGIPLIVKLLEGTQGLGVYLLENKFEAKQLLNKFNKEQTNYLLQEYIEESKGMDVRAFVVGGKVVAAMKRIANKGEFRSNIHRGGRGEKVLLSKAEEFLAIKTAKQLKLDVAGVDILQSKRGPLVLEVNSSPGLEGIEKYTKKNIASAIIKFIESK